MLVQNLSCSSKPNRFVNLASSVTSPILPNHSGNSLTSYCSPRLSLSTSKPHAETALIQAPNPQRHPLDIYRLNISMSSRAPSARAQRNNLSFSFLHSTSALVCLKTLQTSDAPWQATELWHFEAHRRIMPLRAFSASDADGDLVSQLSGTQSNLGSHRIYSLQ